MVTKNMGIYRFLCSYQVLITMVPRDSRVFAENLVVGLCFS